MPELRACLVEKEFGKPRRRLFVVADDAEPDCDDNDAVPATNNKKKVKKKRKTKPAKDSGPASSPGTTTKKKKKVPKKTAKKVTAGLASLSLLIFWMELTIRVSAGSVLLSFLMSTAVYSVACTALPSVTAT